MTSVSNGVQGSGEKWPSQRGLKWFICLWTILFHNSHPILSEPHRDKQPPGRPTTFSFSYPTKVRIECVKKQTFEERTTECQDENLFLLPNIHRGNLDGVWWKTLPSALCESRREAFRKDNAPRKSNPSDACGALGMRARHERNMSRWVVLPRLQECSLIIRALWQTFYISYPLHFSRHTSSPATGEGGNQRMGMPPSHELTRHPPPPPRKPPQAWPVDILLHPFWFQDSPCLLCSSLECPFSRRIHQSVCVCVGGETFDTHS